MHQLHALMDGPYNYHTLVIFKKELSYIGGKEVNINQNEKGGKFLPEPLPEPAVSLTLLLSVRMKKEKNNGIVSVGRVREMLKPLSEIDIFLRRDQWVRICNDKIRDPATIKKPYTTQMRFHKHIYLYQINYTEQREII